MWPKSRSAKKWAKGRVDLPFYRVAPRACVAGTRDTGTSLLPGLMQMVAMGAAICIAKREWAVIGLESWNNLCGHYGDRVL